MNTIFKYVKAVSLVCAMLVFFCFPFVSPVLADNLGVDINKEFGKSLEKAGVGSATQRGGADNITNALGAVMTTFLGLIGVATFVLVVYAGALWILAAGNEEKVAQAQGILKGAIIGLVVVFGAFVIVNFALNTLRQALSTTPPSTDTTTPPSGTPSPLPPG